MKKFWFAADDLVHHSCLQMLKFLHGLLVYLSVSGRKKKITGAAANNESKSFFLINNILIVNGF